MMSLARRLRVATEVGYLCVIHVAMLEHGTLAKRHRNRFPSTQDAEGVSAPHMRQQSLEECAQGGIFPLRRDLYGTFVVNQHLMQASCKAHVLLVPTAESARQTNSRYLEDGHVHMAACALWQRLQLNGEMTCKPCYIHYFCHTQQNL